MARREAKPGARLREAGRALLAWAKDRLPKEGARALDRLRGGQQERALRRREDERRREETGRREQPAVRRAREAAQRVQVTPEGLRPPRDAAPGRSRTRRTEGPTRRELLAEARELGVVGRGEMSKAQLFREVANAKAGGGAVRAAPSALSSRPTGRHRTEGPTRRELLVQARELGIVGRGEMSKARLVREVEKVRSGQPPRKAARSSRRSEGPTRRELLKQARELGIVGRGEMSKARLLREVEQARSGSGGTRPSTTRTGPTEQSTGAASRAGNDPESSSRRRGEGPTRRELLQEARGLGIVGRGGMNKAQLQREVQRARRGENAAWPVRGGDGRGSASRRATPEAGKRTRRELLDEARRLGVPRRTMMSKAELEQEVARRRSS